MSDIKRKQRKASSVGSSKVQVWNLKKEPRSTPCDQNSANESVPVSYQEEPLSDDNGPRDVDDNSPSDIEEVTNDQDSSPTSNLNNNSCRDRRSSRRTVSTKASTTLRRKSSLPNKVVANKKKGKSRYSVYDSSLPSPTTSPQHFNEITHRNKTPRPTRQRTNLRGQNYYTSPALIKPNTPNPSLRRSKRTRLPALRGYANERAIYEFDPETRAYFITGIEKCPIERDFLTMDLVNIEKRQKRNWQERGKKKKRKKDNDRTIHLEMAGSDASDSDGEVEVYDESGELVPRVVTYKNSDPFYFDISGKAADENSQVKLARSLQDDTMSAGQIVLEGFAEKAESKLMGYSVVFYVVKGAVLVGYETKQKIIKERGHFTIPRGNTYSLKNLKKTPAELFFTTFKSQAVDD